MPTPSGPVDGPDVSSNNGAVDENAVRAGGAEFIWEKATEGRTYTDDSDSMRAQGIGVFDGVTQSLAAGLATGAYHFAHPENGNSPEDEADHFLSVVSPFWADMVQQWDLWGMPGKPWCLDLEKGSGDLTDWARRFISRVTARLGGPGWFYSYKSFIQSTINPAASDLGQTFLWLAGYSTTQPSTPAPWSTTSMWQYTDARQTAGLSRPGDFSQLLVPLVHNDQPTTAQGAPAMAVSGIYSWAGRQSNQAFPRFRALAEDSGSCAVASVNNAAFTPPFQDGYKDAARQDFIWNGLWWRRFFNAGKPENYGEAGGSFFLITENGTFDLAKRP